MQYDDIASSRSNPFPGKIFNKPSGTNPGVDVYAGCHINYKGNDVTPKNYLAILKGEKDAVHGGDGKVLESN
jgi:legumain